MYVVVDRWVGGSVGQSVSQSVGRSVGRSVSQSVSWWVGGQSVNQSKRGDRRGSKKNKNKKSVTVRSFWILIEFFGGTRTSLLLSLCHHSLSVVSLSYYLQTARLSLTHHDSRRIGTTFALNVSLHLDEDQTETMDDSQDHRYLKTTTVLGR
jgi:hypothetical protein